MAVPGCGAGTPACCDSVASVCAVSADGHRQDRAPAGPENQAKKGEEQAFVKASVVSAQSVLVDRASNRVIGIHMVEASAPEVMQICPFPVLFLKFYHLRKSYASGSHLKCHIKEEPTLTATRARTWNPPPPGRGRVFDSASHFNPPVTYPPKWASSILPS
eukprot:936431-Pelagomonas_calceolata.AAC.6